MRLQIESGAVVDVGRVRHSRSGRKIRRYDGLSLMCNHLDGLNAVSGYMRFSSVNREMRFIRERFCAVFREHRRDDVDNDIKLGLVSGGDINENVFSIERDFAMVGVDDGRHREYAILGIVNDGIDG